MTTTQRAIRATEADRLQGGRAGFVSRVAADGVDFVMVEIIYFGILLGVAVVKFLLDRGNFEVEAPELWVTLVVQWLIIVLYLGTNWASTGRSIGKIMLGLQVLRADSEPLTPRRAFTRALLCATWWPSLLWVLVSHTNSAVHDILVRTKVVYSWRHEKAAPAPPLSS